MGEVLTEVDPDTPLGESEVLLDAHVALIVGEGRRMSVAGREGARQGRTHRAVGLDRDLPQSRHGLGP